MSSFVRGVNLEHERKAKMRPTTFGIRTPIAAVILAAASFAAQQAKAQAAYTPPTPVPAAPAGGINASTLPDIQGIHLGTTIPDARVKLSALYPSKAPFGVTGRWGKFVGTTIPGWQGSMQATANPTVIAPQGVASDTLSITFSTPPNKQVAVSMDRNVMYQTAKYPTEANVKAALIQKYGPNPIMIGPDWLGWIFDEQGKPVAMTGSVATLKMQCGGNVLAQLGTASSAAEANTGPSPTTNAPLARAQVDQWMRDPCRSGVVVWAKITVSGLYAIGMDVVMSENGEATRDWIVMQEYMDQLGAAQKLQQQRKAQQVATPKL